LNLLGDILCPQRIDPQPRLGIKPLGFVDEDTWNQGKRANGYPVLGNLASLEALLQENSIAEVILSQDDDSLQNLHRLFDICNSFQIPLRRFQARLEEITLDSPVAGSKAQSQRIEVR
jgi:FlaA1/EpsC-like NDP-sugar epimerase